MQLQAYKQGTYIGQPYFKHAEIDFIQPSSNIININNYPVSWIAQKSAPRLLAFTQPTGRRYQYAYI